MTLNILGGVLKGLKLLTPPNDFIRPTSVMIKRKIFDAKQDLSDTAFIDLCAGSGAVGLEAWSRGAKSVYLNESNAKVYSVLKMNVDTIKKSHQGGMNERPIILEKNDCLKVFNKLLDSSLAPSIFYLDPPYENHDTYWTILEQFFKVTSYHELWIESDRQKGITLEQIESRYKIKKVYEHSTHFLAVMKWS